MFQTILNIISIIGLVVCIIIVLGILCQVYFMIEMFVNKLREAYYHKEEVTETE